MPRFLRKMSVVYSFLYLLKYSFIPESYNTLKTQKSVVWLFKKNACLSKKGCLKFWLLGFNKNCDGGPRLVFKITELLNQCVVHYVWVSVTRQYEVKWGWRRNNTLYKHKACSQEIPDSQIIGTEKYVLCKSLGMSVVQYCKRDVGEHLFYPFSWLQATGKQQADARLFNLSERSEILLTRFLSRITIYHY